MSHNHPRNSDLQTANWEYHTYVFEPSWKKAFKNRAINLSIVLVVAVISLFFSITVGLISTTVTILTIIKAKRDFDKDEGLRRFGEKKAHMQLTEEHLYIKQAVIPFSEVQDLLIYADEFTGMRKDEFTNYHGGGNQISLP